MAREPGRPSASPSHGAGASSPSRGGRPSTPVSDEPLPPARSDRRSDRPRRPRRHARRLAHVRRPARGPRHRPDRSARHDPRDHRPVGGRQDDDDPDADRRARARRAARSASSAASPAGSAARDRERIGYMPQLVHAVRGPDGRRERRLRREPVRDALAPAPAPGPRGPEGRRPVGRPRPPGRPAVGRHAAPARARLRPRPRAGADHPRRADRRASTRSSAGRSGTSSIALRDAGRTLLVTTQHVSEAEECDAVAMIVGGRIIALAPPDELRRLGDERRPARHRDRRRCSTAATSSARRASARSRQDGPRHFRVVVDDAGSCPAGRRRADPGRRGRGRVGPRAAALVRRDLRDPRRAPRATASAAAERPPRPTAAGGDRTRAAA